MKIEAKLSLWLTLFLIGLVCRDRNFEEFFPQEARMGASSATAHRILKWRERLLASGFSQVVVGNLCNVLVAGEPRSTVENL